MHASARTFRSTVTDPKIRADLKVGPYSSDYRVGTILLAFEAVPRCA
jgi:hypothetical protein